MSADTKGKKRKSGDNVVPAAKKIKTTTAGANVAKSAHRPAPVKSALKKSNAESTVTAKANRNKTNTTRKVVEEPAADSGEADTIVSDAEGGGADLTADQTEALLAGFTDSEDEDQDDAVDEGIDVAKLPAPPKARKSTKPSDDPESTPGVIYIGRLPHGFYEKQLHAYLSQFGTIVPRHLRLSRNRKTGKSKHFAFVEFESASVADIVAKTMDKYLLFGHILQVRRVPAEQVTEGMWKGPKGIQGGKVRPRNRIEGTRLRKGAERGVWEGRVTREQERRSEKAKKLAEMGYEFEMPDVKTVESVPAQKKIDDKPAEPVVTLHLEGEEPEPGVKLVEGNKKKKQGKGADKKVDKSVETVVEEVPVVTEETTVKRMNKATGTVPTAKKKKVKAAA